MNNRFLLWTVAVVLTIASAVFQRMTGPTHPVSGSETVGGVEVEYTFDRAHPGYSDHVVAVEAKSGEATLYHKRHKTDDKWTAAPMTRSGDSLVASFPKQPAAGKIDYFVKFVADGQTAQLPHENDAIVLRFRGEVPDWVLIPHIFFMFAAMLLSTRTGLEFFRNEPKYKKLVAWTLGALIIGGFIFGPLVQKYAFGEYWTGFPFGYDLTDNKTLIALIAWLAPAYYVFRNKKVNYSPLIAAVVMIGVFLIPHSVLGSELDYDKLDNKNNQGVENVEDQSSLPASDEPNDESVPASASETGGVSSSPTTFRIFNSRS